MIKIFAGTSEVPVPGGGFFASSSNGTTSKNIKNIFHCFRFLISSSDLFIKSSKKLFLGL